MLLNAGADVNIQNNNGETALIWTIKDEKDETAKLLVNAGADVNIQDNDGITALSSLFEKAESNVIIISHYPEQFLEIADRHIKVEKKNKFSELSF